MSAEEGDQHQGNDDEKGVAAVLLHEGEVVLATLNLCLRGLLLSAIGPLSLSFVGCHGQKATGRDG